MNTHSIKFWGVRGSYPTPDRDKIEVDGGIGPATLKAIQNVSVDRVRAYRVLRFANLVIK